MNIGIKRVYDEPSGNDGQRILVDRLWPRGLKKQQARIDHWAKEIAPSTELRRWYQHEPEKWYEFKRLYFEELNSNNDCVLKLINIINNKTSTLLFSSRELRLNNAVALKEYLLTYQA